MARLVTGGLMVLFLMVLAVAGPAMAPFDKDHSENFVTLETEEGPELFVSPLEPSHRHPLGTDNWGYDVLTLLLHGARFSLVLCLGGAFLRVLLGGVIGLALGMGGALDHGFAGGGIQKRRRLMRHIAGVSGGIPAFIILYFILFGINFNPTLSLWGITFLQMGLIVLLGLPQLASAVEEKVLLIRREPFMESGVVVGAGKLRLTFSYVLPFLKESLLLFFSQETVTVLTLAGQLGVFNLFIGGTRLTYSPMQYHSMTHEWAGLVGQYRTLLQGSSWWVLGFPLLGYLFMLFSFYLLSLGLERVLHAHYRQNGGGSL